MKLNLWWLQTRAIFTFMRKTFDRYMQRKKKVLEPKQSENESLVVTDSKDFWARGR